MKKIFGRRSNNLNVLSEYHRIDNLNFRINIEIGFCSFHRVRPGLGCDPAGVNGMLLELRKEQGCYFFEEFFRILRIDTGWAVVFKIFPDRRLHANRSLPKNILAIRPFVAGIGVQTEDVTDVAIEADRVVYVYVGVIQQGWLVGPNICPCRFAPVATHADPIVSPSRFSFGCFGSRDWENTDGNCEEDGENC